MQKVNTFNMHNPLLIYPDFCQPFILSDDASTYALARVLGQERNAVEQPTGYASRQLDKAEINYSTAEKERRKKTIQHHPVSQHLVSVKKCSYISCVKYHHQLTQPF